MPANAVATPSYVSQNFPPGTDAIATYRFELLDSANAVVSTQNFTTAPTTVTFTSVAPGTGYKVRGSQWSAAPAQLGSYILSAAFDVLADVTLTVVGAITVSVVRV